MTESARLVITVDSTQAAKAGTDLSALERQATKTEVGISALAKTAVAAFGALKLGGAISDAVMLASRYDQLGLVMNTVAGNTGRSTVELAALDGELRKVGISAVQSRNNIIKMMSANIDLAQATKLAKLAQDAAVIGNTNSSEAFERLIKGIQSAEKETLETLGLNVNFQQSYEKLAKQLGKNADQLTTTEKTQAGVNAAMEAGKNIAGSYQASLTNAGKQLQSSTRYLEDLKVSLGAAAQPAFGLAVDGYVGSLKFLNENVGAVTQALETGLFIAVGRTVAAVGASSVAFARDVVAKQAAATASLALAESEAIEAASNLRATTARHAAFASHVEVTAATNANSAAQLRLAAAQKASSVATAAAVGAGSRVLGLMGGPVGIALTVGAAALSFLDFGDKAKTGMGAAANATEQAATRIRNATRNMLPGNLETLPYGDIQAKLGDVGGQLEKAKRELDGFQKSFDAGSISEQWLAEPRERVAALEGAYQKLKSEADGARFASDKAGSTYIESLGRQAALVGKVTEVEKLRANVQAGFIKLSATDLQAAEEKAAAIDRSNESMRAGSLLEKESVKDAKARTAALADLISQSEITISSTNAMADAYLSGADNVRELAIQQKIEEELLKTGAGARDAVTAAVNREADAKDRLDIDQSIASMRVETTNTLAQATATLQGADALETFNIQKSMSIALSGKKIDIGSKEYEQLLEQTKAQLAANKALEQASKVEGIIDRLNPQIKLLKDYTAERDALNAAMIRDSDNVALYQDALAKLGQEYEVNRSKATIWGQMTEGAIDRIDEAFASAWGNIGSGAESLWDNLKKGFKQTLGEIAHMLTTKPLLASISNWLTGTDNGQGLSSVWSKLLGGASGSSSSSGGGLFGSGNTLVSMGKSIYQAYSAITGVGSSIASGYASGGVGGAISGGVGYYGNLLSSLGTTLSGGFSSIVGAITGSTATQVAANAATSAALQGAVAQGATQVGTSIGIGGAAAAGAGTAAAAGAGAGFYASLAAMASNPVGWVIAAVTSAYQSGKLYDQGVRWNTKDVMNTDLVKYSGGIGQATLAPLAITNNVLEKIVGGKMAAIFSGSTFASAIITKVSEKIFGGSWVTKDGGLSLGIDGGDFSGRQYINQKKKGGLFSSSKKRTRYSALDPQMEEALKANYYDTQYSVLDLFARLNVALNDGVMDGLNVADTKISTKGKTADQIQEAIAKWFGGVADSMVSAVDSATNSGLGNYNFEELTTFVNNLYSVNDSFKMLGLKLYDVSVSTGFMAEQLIAMAGGLEALKTAESTFFDGFYTDVEKADYALSTVTKQFAAIGVTLPATRDAYRGMVEALDLTTESGRQMYIMLTGMSDSAAQAFDILESRTNALNESMMGAVTGAQGALQRAISAQQKKATEAYNATNTSLNDMVSTVTENVNGLNSVSNSLSTALKALRGDSDDAVKMLRAQAQATLQSALATARSGKSLSGFTGLEDALDTVSNNNAGLYGSMEAFARDQGRTANVVAELNALNGKQLTSAEKSLEGLKAQIDQAKKSYDLQMSQYDAQLTLAQAQIDALNGVDNSVVSVAAAVNSLSQAIVASLAIKGDDSARQNTFDNNAALVQAVYRTVLGRDAEAKGLADWAGALSGGLVTYDELMASIARQGKVNGETIMPGYASGGLISGPGTGTSDSIFARLSNGEYVMSADAVRMFGTGLLDQMNAGLLPAFANGGAIGEAGPQLAVTAPSRIYNANQAGSMSGGGDGQDAANEVRQLRAELKSALFAIAKSTMKTAKNTDLLPRKLEQELFV